MPPTQQLAVAINHLARSNPSNPITQRATRLLKLCSRNAQNLSPMQRALVGKALALVVDINGVSVAPNVSGDADGGWLSDAYDAIMDKLAAAGEVADQALLDTANELDALQQKVKAGVEDAPLALANELDKMYIAVSEQVGNTVKNVAKGTALLGAGLMPLALGVAAIVLLPRFIGGGSRGRR